MQNVTNVKDHPDVKAAKARHSKERSAITEAQNELEALHEAQQEAEKEELRAEAAASIGDVDEVVAKAATRKAKDAKEAVREKEREIERRKVALEMLEGKVVSAEALAGQELSKSLEGRYVEAVQAIVDALTQANAALAAGKEIERTYLSNGIEPPTRQAFTLGKVQRASLVRSGGKAAFPGSDFVTQAAGAGFEPTT